MTTIKARFQGNKEDLKTALVSAIHHTSKSEIKGDELFVEWICEESNYEQALTGCQDSVNLEQLETNRVELIGIG